MCYKHSSAAVKREQNGAALHAVCLENREIDRKWILTLSHFDVYGKHHSERGPNAVYEPHHILTCHPLALGSS